MKCDSVHNVCPAECYVSEAVVPRQQEDGRVSADMNAQPCNSTGPVAMIWGATIGRAVLSIGSARSNIGQDHSCQTVNKYQVMSPRWGSTPRHTN
jgi:hypothetical protein